MLDYNNKTLLLTSRMAVPRTSESRNLSVDGPEAGLVKMFGSKASNTRLVLILCFSDCAMPCHDSEEEMNARDDDPPRTPTKPTGNGGAGRVDPDGENDSDEQDSDDMLDEPSANVKRKWNGHNSKPAFKPIPR